MKIIKLLLLAIMGCMYQIALSENGIVKAVSWILFIGLFILLVARMEKLYDLD